MRGAGRRELPWIGDVGGWAVRRGGQLDCQLWAEAMPIDRARADQYLALLGLVLSFLFLLAVVALALTAANGINDPSPSIAVQLEK